MCFAAIDILLMRNWNHALGWRMEDHFPELWDSDLNMKTSLVMEW